ncbi:MAG: hypothetical protein H7Y11_15785, partial [Armatimonadetes bacterium]|nr:hypothetical protein [Anaerolineae bacterium]
MRRNAYRMLIGLLLALGCIGLPAAADQPPQDPAPVINDEGGALFIRGTAEYTFPYFSLFLPQPYVVLYDFSGQIIDRDVKFYPSPESQSFGVIITDPFSSPFKYELALPARPQGVRRDVDHNGRADGGVMLFGVTVASNTFGGPFLEERDNYVVGIMNSILLSTDIDRFLELDGGKLIIYAPDDAQGFPSGFGADGRLFTDDDPIVSLPAGYTVVELTPGGDFVFDRSAEPSIALLEAEDAELDDFSDLGYTESFDAMIDLLREEYAFTEYKKIDWDDFVLRYRPLIVEAEADEDVIAYRKALADLSLEIPDGHVSGPVSQEDFQAAAFGGLGLALRQLDDGRVLVTYLLPASPADVAGVKPGAEVVSIDDVAIQDALAQTRIWSSVSTPHNLRLQQLTYVVRFPPDTNVALTWRNPGDDETRSADLTTVVELESLRNSGYQLTGEPLTPGAAPIEYILRPDGFAYVKIYSFSD